MARHSTLIEHELHGHLRADEHAEHVHLDHGFNRFIGHLEERFPATVERRVVDPVVHRAQLFFRRCGELADRRRVRDVADLAEDRRVGAAEDPSPITPNCVIPPAQPPAPAAEAAGPVDAATCRAAMGAAYPELTVVSV